VPLLDRNGWAEERFEIVAWDEFDPAQAHEGLGILVPNDLHPRALREVQDKVGLIAIAFPRHNDGRGFSLGRLLRQQGFGGTLRASGHIIPDQFGFALRDGFDEVEISDEQAARQPAGDWLHAAGLVSAAYQGAGSIFQQRRAAR
jgi:uncharacterized protein (DUF934 family)